MKTPLVYSWSQESMALCAIFPAVESPAEPGVYLLPAYATFMPPPAWEPNRTLPVWSPEHQAWVLRKLRKPSVWQWVRHFFMDRK